MKKLWIIGGTIVLLIGLFCAGYYFYDLNKPKPDEVFEKYVKSMVSSSVLAQTQTANGTGSILSLKGFNDTSAKKYLINADANCIAKYNGKDVSIQATYQVENQKTYIKLNSISGDYTANNGNTYKLPATFSKVVGVWYDTESDNSGVESLLNSGVAAYNSAVLAPTYDTKAITDEIINTKVFSYKSYKKNDNKYVFQFVSDRNAYASLFKNKLSNVSNADIVLDSIFDGKSTIDSVVTVDKNGNYIEEELPTNNICTNVFKIYIGEEANSIAKEISSKAVKESKEKISITPVTNPKLLSNMSKDMNL